MLTDAHVDKMFSLFANEAEEQHVSHFASFEDIVAADYNLSVSTYVEARDLREKIDIDQLEARLSQVVSRITELRTELDDIVKALRSA